MCENETLRSIAESGRQITIVHDPGALLTAGSTRSPTECFDNGKGCDATIALDLRVPDTGSHEVEGQDCGKFVPFPADVMLMHELAHALRVTRGRPLQKFDLEADAIVLENVYRAQRPVFDWSRVGGQNMRGPKSFLWGCHVTTRASAPRRIAAIILDMDGLMIDSESVSMEAWFSAGRSCGFDVSRELFLEMMGTTEADANALLLRELGSEAPISAMRASWREHVDHHIARHGIDRLPGIEELLTFIDSSALPRAVATSSRRSMALRKLRAASLLERCPLVVSADEVQRGKPDPEIFLRAAEALETPAESCLVLEDSEQGVRAARNANMMVVVVPGLKFPSTEISRLADAVLSSLHEVTHYLRRSIARFPVLP